MNANIRVLWVIEQWYSKVILEAVTILRWHIMGLITALVMGLYGLTRLSHMAALCEKIQKIASYSS